ncbi:Cleavage factor two protein 2 [Smittium culicis]|uniref:Cleavage and polyadenylation specificity factor subunit 2 n=1 Tax=Smittium culicis TaxID=133412 RepID=A0A1R1YEN2_9FUNG|nr:Cleavage factor two protein 2 [Smittium culicis]
MGKISVSSIVKDLQKERGLDLSQEDVSEAFNHITTLRYSQPTNLPGKCKEINICAFSAGHSLGGSIWKIKKGIDEILYAIDYNHIRESHLSATSLLHRGQVIESMLRPTLLITSACNATRILPTQKSRKDALFEFIKTHLKGTGIAMMPVDTATRVLELTYLIERFMDSYYGNVEYKPEFPKRIFLLSRYGNKVFRFARSMLEWMNDSLGNEFSGNRKNPFDLKHIQIVNSYRKLEKLILEAQNSFKKEGIIVLVNGEDFDFGYSRKLFDKLASSDINKIILTQRGSSKSLSRILYDLWFQKAKHKELENLDTNENGLADADINSEPLKNASQMSIPLGIGVLLKEKIKIPSYKKVALEGDELVQYQEKKRKEKEEKEAQVALLLDEEMSEEEFDNIDNDQLNGTSEIGVNDFDFNNISRRSFSGLPSKIYRKFSSNKNENKSLENYILNTEMSKLLSGVISDIYFNSSSQNKNASSNKSSIFPFVDKRKRMSDYGEVLDIDHFKKPIVSQDKAADDENRLESIPESFNSSFKNDNRTSNMGNISKKAKTEIDNYKNKDYSDDSSGESENDDNSENNSLSKSEFFSGTKSIELGDSNAGDIGYKYVKEYTQFEINCSVTFLDFEGRADSRSMHNIIAQIEPRRIVVVDGDEVSTEYFCQLCATNDRMTDSIFAPALGEVLNVSTRAKAYSVKLSDSLLNSLKFAQPKPHSKNISKLLLFNESSRSYPKFNLFSKAEMSKSDSLALANSTLEAGDSGKKNFGEELRISRVRGIWRVYGDSNVPVLDLPNLEERQMYNDIKYAGDLKLSLLKRGLIANGINAYFQGDGVLVCNDTVKVEKNDEGLVEIEGDLSPEFFKIRTVLYNLLAVI